GDGRHHYVAYIIHRRENLAARSGQREGVDKRPARSPRVTVADAEQHLARLLALQGESPGQVGYREGRPLLAGEIEALHHLCERRGEQLLGRVVPAQTGT